MKTNAQSIASLPRQECEKCGYTPKDNLSWQSVYARWKSVGVKQVEVLDYDATLHPALWWFHKPKKAEIYINQNPINDTAKMLTAGKVKANDEIYAAFALYATTRGYRCWSNGLDTTLKNVAYNRLIQMDVARYYWTGQAKHVIPYAHGMDELWELGEAQNLCWCAYIAATANMWNHLAEDWVALKYPCTYTD